MISVDRFFGNCNVVYDLSMKICVSSKTNDINIKLFDIIARINETKTLVKHTLTYFNMASISNRRRKNRKKL